MSFAKLAPVCSCGQEVPGLNPHPNIYYNTFAEKKQKIFIYLTNRLGRELLRGYKNKCNNYLIKFKSC